MLFPRFRTPLSLLEEHVAAATYVTLAVFKVILYIEATIKDVLAGHETFSCKVRVDN
jgi:hypothetical protein